MKDTLKKIGEFMKLPLQIALGVVVATFIDHFASKPAIHSLESLIGKNS